MLICHLDLRGGPAEMASMGRLLELAEQCGGSYLSEGRLVNMLVAARVLVKPDGGRVRLAISVPMICVNTAADAVNRIIDRRGFDVEQALVNLGQAPPPGSAVARLQDEVLDVATR